MHHDIVVIGASAGGVEALATLFASLPENLPAAVFVVLHLPPDSRSTLPQILQRAGQLPAAHAHDGDHIESGRVYVASPDLHLLVEQDRVQTSRGPRENRHRPAVDVLFRSAALAYGSRVIGVILSGALDDGTAGLAAIKQRGGLAVVQDPDDALIPAMPQSALEHVEVDYRVPVAEMAAVLEQMVRLPVPEKSEATLSEIMHLEHAMAKSDSIGQDLEFRSQQLSDLTCPECSGPLWMLQDGSLQRFRCRVGHAYSTESLVSAQDEEIEQMLWMVLNRLEERKLLAERLASQVAGQGHERVAARFEQKARDAQRRADFLRQAISVEVAKP